ncbi:MAG: metallopeptidase family protein [Elusimicrobia bacterium]|nr:metallopeptidase family protein [Elusimicrobiota bacterium]
MHVPRRLFEKLAGKAVKELPEYFKQKMENVIVTVRYTPDRKQKKRFGKNLLGLYEGIPLAERGQSYSGAMPDKITVFQRNIESSCSGRSYNSRHLWRRRRCSGKTDIKKEIRHVLMHEIAHHFGITDERLKQEGIY